MPKFYPFYFVFYGFLVFSAQAYTPPDSVRQWVYERQDEKNNPSRTRALLQYCKWLVKKKPDSVIYFASQSDGIADVNQRARFLWIVAEAYGQKRNIDKMNSVLAHAVNELKKGEGSRQLLAETYSVKGGLLLRQALYDKALEAYLQNAQFAREYELPEVEKYAYLNIAVLAKRLKQYDRALKYLQKSREVTRVENDSLHRVSLSLNTASVYAMQGKQRERLAELQRSRPLIPQERRTELLAHHATLSGQAHCKLEQYSEAIQVSHEGLEASRQIGHLRMELYALETLIKSFLAKKQQDSALYYVPKIREVAGHVPSAELKETALRTAQKAYSACGEYRLAALLQDTLYALSREVIDFENEKQALELEAKYHLQEAEQANEILAQKNIILEQENAKSRLVLISTVLGALLLLAVAGLGYGLKVQRNKALRSSIEQAEVQLQNAQLRETNLQTEKKLIEEQHKKAAAELQNERLARENESMQKEILEKDLRHAEELIEGKNKTLTYIKGILAESQVLQNPAQIQQELTLLMNDLQNDLQEMHGQNQILLQREDFLTRLKINHPKLSDKDIRLLNYIKHGYSNKEMGNFLGISPDSVTKSKYRIKKKLKLEGDNALEEFVAAA